MRAIKKWGTLLSTLFIASLSLTFFLSRSNHVAFDKQTWQDEALATTTPYIRTQMIDSVLAHILSVGMSKAAVIEQLGPPNTTEYFSDYDLHYWLGPETGAISIDSSWLLIKLKDGTVKTYKVESD